MIAFEAYLDDSGTHDDSRVTVVAGAYAEYPTWRSVESEWADILSKYNIKVFHSADLAHFQGEFKQEYGWDEERRKGITNDLLAIVNSHAVVPITIGVQNSIFYPIKEGYPELQMSPFQLCCECIIAQVGIKIFGETEKNSLALVFEDSSHAFYTPSIKHCRHLLQNALQTENCLNISITHGCKSNPCLQMADMFAYESCKHWVRGSRKMRYPLEQYKHKIGPCNVSGRLLQPKTICGWLKRTDDIRKKFS